MKILIGFIVLTLSFLLVVPHLITKQDKVDTEEDAFYPREEQLEKIIVHRPRPRRYVIWARSTNDTVEACSSSSEDFPNFFTEKQVERGAIILVFFIGIYCFTLLAIICDNYFLPCVEKICEALNLSHDVAAATFMSVATSAPELFVNIIGTFITESDIGIGTVVGSSLFNTLGVASLGGLAASAPVQLHWWPVTRDVFIYVCSILLLVGITWDGKIYWYEGLVLFIVYFVYFTVMFQNAKFSKLVHKLLRRDNKVSVSNNNCEKGHSAVTITVNDCEKRHSSVSVIVKDGEKRPSAISVSEKDCEKGSSTISTAHTISSRDSIAVISSYGSYVEEPIVKYSETKSFAESASEEEKGISIFQLPRGSIWKIFFFFYTWPIKFVLFCTVPDPQRYPKLFPLTFILCIFFIGSNSYVVSWMISIIGNMFKIPDAVLGLTFLAAGGCLPEAISITIMSRRGEGSMGVSNSLGANTMNILLSLGMPWFLKTIIMGTGKRSFIRITSGSIEYTISALVPVALTLYLTLYFNKFRLSRKVGVILLLVYCMCIVLAILAELVFFDSPNCIA